MIATKGRLIALSSAALLLLSACSSPGASPTGAASAAPPSEAASAPAGSPAGSRPPAGSRSGICPRTSSTPTSPPRRPASTRVSPNWVARRSRPGTPDPDAPLQIPLITDLRTKGVDAIIISADDPDAVAPALKEAMEGHQGRRFRRLAGGPRLRCLRQPNHFSKVGVNLAEWACELAPDCTGDIAILSAKATSPNQNAWIELMKSTSPTDPKFAKLKLVDTVYGKRSIR